MENEKPVDPIDLDELSARVSPSKRGRADYCVMLSCAELSALIAEVRACRDKELAPTYFASNHEAGDGQTKCQMCEEDTEEGHSLTVCVENMRSENDALWNRVGLLEEKLEPSPAVGEALAALDVLCDVFPGLSSTAGEHTIRDALKACRGGRAALTEGDLDAMFSPEAVEEANRIRAALERAKPAKSVEECPSDLSPAELAEQHCPFWEMSPAEREEENAKRGPCGKSYWAHDGNEVCALTRGHAGGCR